MSNKQVIISLAVVALFAGIAGPIFTPQYSQKLRAYFFGLNPVTQTAGQWTTGKRVSVSHSLIFSKGGLRHIFYQTEYDTSGNVTQFTPYRIDLWPPFDGPIKKH